MYSEQGGRRGGCRLPLRYVRKGCHDGVRLGVRGLTAHMAASTVVRAAASQGSGSEGGVVRAAPVRPACGVPRGVREGFHLV